MQPKRDVLIKTNWREWGRIPQGCLGASDPQIWVEDGVDQGGIWCEGEEGREKSSSVLAFGRRQGEVGDGWVGPARGVNLPGQTPGSVASGPFATSAGQRAGGQCGPGARRQGPWRLLRNPDARDLGVTEKDQKRKKFRNEVKSGFSLP